MTSAEWILILADVIINDYSIIHQYAIMYENDIGRLRIVHNGVFFHFMEIFLYPLYFDTCSSVISSLH